MNRTQKRQCREIAERYGVSKQERQTISEIAELNYVLTRRMDQRGANWKEDLTEEIADVFIMIQQLTHLYGITKHDVDFVIDEKLERQLGRIERGDPCE